MPPSLAFREQGLKEERKPTQLPSSRRFTIVRHQAARAEPPVSLSGASWEALRLLLLVAEKGSVRQAARRAGLDQATVRARLDQLEKHVGEPLFEMPTANTIKLSTVAVRLVDVARAMRSQLDRPPTSLQDAGFAFEDFVSVTMAEGVGARWLVPRLARLLSDDRELRLATRCISGSFQAIPRHLECVIQMDRPLAAKAFTVERLGSLHFIPAASKRYVEQHGLPTSLETLTNHRFVWQYGDVSARVSLRALLDYEQLRGATDFVAESASTNCSAIRNGCGIGLLPTFADLHDDNLCWINLGGRIKRDLYLAFDPACRGDVRMAKVLEALRLSFDPHRFPWFADRFIHPRDVDRALRLTARASLMDAPAPG